MSAEIDAVYEELRRLKLEGVERVFVDDRTLDLLAAITPTKQRPAAETTAPKQPAAGIDLKAQVAAQDAAPASRPPQTTPSPPASRRRSDTDRIPTTGPALTLPDGEAGFQLNWLRDQVNRCPTCLDHLPKGARPVFGTGPSDADIFICGDAPGAEEVRSGEPFTDDAGQLLDKILQAMGLSRQDVYLSTILKWSPDAPNQPGSRRPPSPRAMNFCLPYLKAQLAAIQPKVIVALGNATVTGLLGPEHTMASVRGTWQAFQGIDTMVTFHPFYLLHNGTLQRKRLAWEDLLQVMERVGLPVSEKQRGFFLPK